MPWICSACDTSVDIYTTADERHAARYYYSTDNRDMSNPEDASDSEFIETIGESEPRCINCEGLVEWHDVDLAPPIKKKKVPKKPKFSKGEETWI